MAAGPSPGHRGILLHDNTAAETTETGTRRAEMTAIMRLIFTHPADRKTVLRGFPRASLADPFEPIDVAASESTFKRASVVHDLYRRDVRLR